MLHKVTEEREREVRWREGRRAGGFYGKARSGLAAKQGLQTGYGVSLETRNSEDEGRDRAMVGHWLVATWMNDATEWESSGTNDQTNDQRPRAPSAVANSMYGVLCTYLYLLGMSHSLWRSWKQRFDPACGKQTFRQRGKPPWLCGPGQTSIRTPSSSKTWLTFKRSTAWTGLARSAARENCDTTGGF